MLTEKNWIKMFQMKFTWNFFTAYMRKTKQKLFVWYLKMSHDKDSWQLKHTSKIYE